MMQWLASTKTAFLPKIAAFSFKIDARYRKQAFELIVDVEDPDFSPSEIERLKESFHKAHLQRFSFDDREETIECVNPPPVCDRSTRFI